MTSESSRRSFLKTLGLSAGATLVSSNIFGSFVDKDEILKLNPEQQKFMTRYESWMDQFTNVIRIQKSEPENMDNQKAMISLTEQAELFKPELAEFMKDEKFALIYKASIERMSKEI